MTCILHYYDDNDMYTAELILSHWFLFLFEFITRTLVTYLQQIKSHQLLCFLLTDTIKDLIDHFSDYLTTEMDSDLIVQHMLSQQLLNDQEVHTMMSAASDYQKNCLVVERIRLMDTQSLVSFCKILQKFYGHDHISRLLMNGT